MDKSTACEGSLNIACYPNSSHVMNLHSSCHPQKGNTIPHGYNLLLISGTDPGFPTGGVNSRFGGSDLRRRRFSAKTFLYQNERIGSS